MNNARHPILTNHESFTNLGIDIKNELLQMFTGIQQISLWDSWS